MKKIEKIKIWMTTYQDCTPMHYVTSQWQSGKKSTGFFLFRLLSFVWFVESLILSFIQVKYTPEYWLVYYTHWSFLLATVQSGIALVLVSMNQADAFNPNGGRIQNRVCRVYEFIHAAATTQALGVTILFWAAVYNPKNGSPNIQTIQVHAINSVMMLLDLCLVAFPIRAISVIVPFCVSLGYLIFNLIYFLVGGKNYNGKVYIYGVLDWTKPVRAGLFSVLVAVLIIILFGLIWFISLMRRVVHSKIGTRRNLEISQSERNISISTIA